MLLLLAVGEDNAMEEAEGLEAGGNGFTSAGIGAGPGSEETGLESATVASTKGNTGSYEIVGNYSEQHT